MRSRHATMAREQRAGVLHAEVALEERLEEVAQRRRQRDADADEQRLRSS